MRPQYLKYASIVFALVLSASAHGLPGESIVLDPITGNYTITYFGYDEVSGEQTALRVATFEPATKIDPSVKSLLKMNAGGFVEYGYRVRNGSTSRQSIVMILFDPIADLATTTTPLGSTQPNSVAENYGVATYPINTPNPWTGWVIDSVTGAGLRAGWSSVRASIPVGGAMSGFGFFSKNLPGIGIAQLRGRAAIREFVDEGPDGEVGDQLDKLVQNNFVIRNAAVPIISVPTPFDPAIVLDNLRTHIATWPSKQLADATVVAQLDAELVATTNAYRANQPQVARDHIEILLDLIRREHKDIDREDDDEHDNKRIEQEADRKATTQAIRLDRLAARVLDFDLKYVLKRMKKEDDEHETKKH